MIYTVTCCDDEGMRLIRDHPNYWVSDAGFVYRRQGNDFTKLAYDMSNGIARVSLDGIKLSVAKLVMDYFWPTDDETLKVFHIDGNHENNRLENLVWLSSKEIQLYSTFTVEFRRTILGRGRD